MTDSWWDLPGPARFLSGAVRSLRLGKNVILALPSHSPDPLRALRSSLESEWQLLTIRLSEEGRHTSPLDLLFSRFVPNAPPSTLRSAVTLVAEESFSGKLLFIDELSDDQWQLWKAFLLDYEHVCRSIPQIERTLFCIRLAGRPATDPPQQDVCIAVHRYDNVQLIDATLYAWLLIENSSLPPLEKRVAASGIAAVSLWDPILAERLAQEPFPRILKPEGLLRDVARERDWCQNPGPPDADLWHMGGTCSIDGVDKLHSAVLAATNRIADVERRLWSAQVGVLFPYIEERRQEIVERLSGVLKVPFRKDDGEIVEDLRDLEIGHIEAQIRTVPRIGENTLRLVRKLRKVRNHLSHLELVPAELVSAPEFAR